LGATFHLFRFPGGECGIVEFERVESGEWRVESVESLLYVMGLASVAGVDIDGVIEGACCAGMPSERDDAGLVSTDIPLSLALVAGLVVENALQDRFFSG
jgi:hypothetical protein